MEVVFPRILIRWSEHKFTTHNCKITFRCFYFGKTEVTLYFVAAFISAVFDGEDYNNDDEDDNDDDDDDDNDDDDDDDNDDDDDDDADADDDDDDDDTTWYYTYKLK